MFAYRLTLAALPMAFVALSAAEPDLSKDTTAKAIEADAAFLKKSLDKPFAAKHLPYLRVTAAMIALNGSDDTRTQAAKVSDALSKKAKDYGAAKEAFAKWKPAAGAKGNAARLIDSHKLTLEAVMNHFGASQTGGLNIGPDLKTELAAKNAEILAARVAALGEFTEALPPGPKPKLWGDLCRDMGRYARELATEAAKGDKASKSVLKQKQSEIEQTCVSCHTQFK